MALIAVAADKGAPGVTTTALALASVWPDPVLLAECDPAGGDLVFRFPAADGRQLDPRRGLLSLAVAGRRDYQQQHVWPHVQKIHGGLDALLGVTNAEQGAGLSTLWGPLGKMLATLPDADVIADCGRLGPEGPFYDLLAEADSVLLVARADLGSIIRLRDRAAVVVSAAGQRGHGAFAVDALTIAEAQRLKNAEAEVTHALAQAGVPVRLSCGLADDRKGAELLSGTWGGKLDKTLLIRTAREVAGQLAAQRQHVPQRGLHTEHERPDRAQRPDYGQPEYDNPEYGREPEYGRPDYGQQPPVPQPPVPQPPVPQPPVPQSPAQPQPSPQPVRQSPPSQAPSSIVSPAYGEVLPGHGRLAARQAPPPRLVPPAGRPAVPSGSQPPGNRLPSGPPPGAQLPGAQPPGAQPPGALPPGNQAPNVGQGPNGQPLVPTFQPRHASPKPAPAEEAPQPDGFRGR
ncbi:MAG TPA: hypothetical protein VK817_15235 [Trebonia sp.]|jgi:hypothetical protein|nr:hypothetical protein [Trebonia sp.]